MRQNKNYSLQFLNNIPYLIPFGQARCNYKKSVQINDTGAILWNLSGDITSNNASLDTILKKYMQHPDVQKIIASDCSLEYELLEDAKAFLEALIQLGILIPDECDSNKIPDEHNNGKCSDCEVLENSTKFPAGDFSSTTLSIADSIIKVNCSDSKLNEILFTNPVFKDFIVNVAKPANDVEQKNSYEMTIDFISLQALDFNELNSYFKNFDNQLIVFDQQLEIRETKDNYLIRFMINTGDLHIILNKNGRTARAYYSVENIEISVNSAFHSLRFMYLYHAATKNIFAIHSASIIFDNKAWIFSGPSGTGKSTHTNLWKKLYDVTIFNGDLNLIGMKNGIPVIYGLPWCGTSQITHNGMIPLGGIVLLKQAPENQIIELTAAEKILSVFKRYISPTWTEELLNKQFDFTTEIAGKIKIFKYCCTKEDSAASYLHDYLNS